MKRPTLNLLGNAAENRRSWQLGFRVADGVCSQPNQSLASGLMRLSAEFGLAELARNFVRDLAARSTDGMNPPLENREGASSGRVGPVCATNGLTSVCTIDGLLRDADKPS